MVDIIEWGQMADHLEANGDYCVLRRVPTVERYAQDEPNAAKRLGLIIDVETTGLDPNTDKIIELAILPFHFSSDGVIFDLLLSYAGFEDPGQSLSDEVAQLTGQTYVNSSKSHNIS